MKTIFDRIDEGLTAWLGDRQGTAAPAPAPPSSGPGTSPAPIPAGPPSPAPPSPIGLPVPPPAGVDTSINGFLSQAWNGRVDPFGPPDWCDRTALGNQPNGFSSIPGFDRWNWCQLWTGWVLADYDGPIKWSYDIKSAGRIAVNGVTKAELDREQDPGGHSTWAGEFTTTHKAGEWIKLDVLQRVQEGAENRCLVYWQEPGDTQRSPVTMSHACPPLGWQLLVKAFLPPPPPAPDVDWSKVTMEDIAPLPLPPDSPWLSLASNMPRHPRSDDFINTLLALGGPTVHAHPIFGAGGVGIPYNVVPASTPRSSVSFLWPTQSNAGPYPIGSLVEPGSDRHLVTYVPEEGREYDLGGNFTRGAGGYSADAGAIFDLKTNALRPDGWTSTDAAGLAILPGLVRYQEVAAGKVGHVIRVTVGRTRKAFLHPATHWASIYPDDDLLPMGARLRLRSDYDLSGLKPQARIVAQAMKDYGLIVADNGSPGFFGVCGTPDARWDNNDLGTLRTILASAFEVIAWNDADLLFTPAP